ncbi:MAG: sulfurtransferase [Deltaproteobacteria bacterium]|nr:sulfurtransferase [Deltaproteobacteria bacterium]
MQHSDEFQALVDDAKSRVRETTLAAWPGLAAAGALLIDVREDREWRAGHAAGARHLGRGVLERDIVGAVPNKGQVLVLYCGGGYRSALAADNLQKMGYGNVLSLAGGWKAWVAAGLPTEVDG